MLSEDYPRAKGIYQQTTGEDFDTLPTNPHQIEEIISNLPPIFIGILMGEFKTSCLKVLSNQLYKVRIGIPNHYL